jgi:hypothetical protein
MELVAMDYVSPLPSNGYLKHFLIFIDFFSRFPEVYPCSDLLTTTLISKTVDFFARFPDAILAIKEQSLNVKSTLVISKDLL